MNYKNKNAIIIITLINLYSFDSFATPFYVGISGQQQDIHLESNMNSSAYTGSSTNMNKATNIVGFAGYEFGENKINPYKLSIEASYYQDYNDLSSATSYYQDSQENFLLFGENQSYLKSKVLSFNTIHTYNLKDRFNLIGIVGVSYYNFKFTENITEYNIDNDNYSYYHGMDKINKFGFNLGIGFSIRMPKMYYDPLLSERITLRTKIVHSFFKIKPDIIFVDEITGKTSLEIDMIIHF